MIEEAPVWGIRLERRADKLAITPGSKCPQELRELLVEHKAEILDLLEARAAGLQPDQAPWLHVARQILEREWDGCDGSTRESLSIGLRNIQHPKCRAALERLKAAA